MAMQRGSSGPLVRSWQQFLVAQQLLPAAELAVEGEVFSAATAEATLAYQRRSGLFADGIAGDQTLTQAEKDGYTGVASTPQYLLLYGLRSGAFAGWEHPGALVHAPPDFDPRELTVVIYLHGIENNIENVVREAPVSPDYPVADLLGNLARSQRNALLIVPELRHNGSSPDPGRLGEPGALPRLLAEVLGKLPAPLTGLLVSEIRRLVMISHSGGYRAAVPMAVGGGLRVDELYLLDSLYGLEDEVTAFVVDTLAEVASADQSGLRLRRLVNLYTRGGRPAELSRALARRAHAEASRQQLPAEVVQTADEELEPEAVPAGPRVLSQPVAVAHSEIPRRYIGPLLEHSGLPARRS